MMREILDKALDLPENERPGYLDAACPGAAMRAEMETLLRAAERTAFIDHPAIDGIEENLTIAQKAAEPRLAAGSVFGHYEIVGRLGEGGMGAVFRAVDRSLGRTVALKVISRDVITNSDRKRFEREAKAASALNHPNIVTIYEYSAVDGVEFIAMEYVEGTPLDRILATRQLPESKLFFIAAQVASALAKAHAAGIVHRDLKPANIMVRPDGQAKVLDFGLAKQSIANAGDESEQATETGITSAGMVLGTPAYMSPEQALGDSVDSRSDIFSFGVILYELACGRRPFQGANAMATLRQVVHAEPVPPLEVTPSLAKPLARLIEQCLTKDREQRLQSLADVPGVIESHKQEARPSIRAARGGRVTWAAGGVAVALVGVWSGRDTISEWLGRPALTAPRTSYEHYEIGQGLLNRQDRKGNYDKAITSFQASIAADGDNAGAYAGLAAAYFVKQRATPDPQWLRMGREAAESAVAKNPDLAVARAAKAVALLLDGKQELASSEAARAVQLDPRSSGAHQAMGEVMKGRRDFNGAEREFRRAVELAPGDWRPVYDLGTVLYHSARYEEAANVWKGALKITPDNDVLHRNLASAYHMMGEYDMAAASFQSALLVEPSAATYNNLGTLRFFQGRYSDAVPAFEKAVELRATSYFYWGNLGDAYRWAAGQRTKSGAAYATAIRIARGELEKQPANVDVRSRLALYLAKSGDKAAARAEAGALPESATSGAFHFRVCVAWELLGERVRALASIQRALKAGYASGEIEHEPELTGLRTDRRYQLLLSSLKK